MTYLCLISHEKAMATLSFAYDINIMNVQRNNLSDFNI